MSLEPLTDSPIPPLAAVRDRPLAPSEAPPLPSCGPPSANPSRLTLRQRWQRFPSSRAVWLTLLAFTLLGIFFRYWRISYQSYWTDESYTVYRIHGTFAQMLAALSDQGFPPGWYVLLRWWSIFVEYLTGSGFTALSPESLRGFTAVFGVCTIPAMYFLARQFTDRKGALLVALLTAVNPYLIYYSRDIKMYPATWLFIILNLAIFFKWQTTHKHLLWFPLYLLTGFLMVAMHSVAWFMIGLQLIFLLTRPRIRSLDAPLWVFAVGVMALLPAYWYLNRTSFFDKAIDREGNLGLNFVKSYTDMSWTTIGSLPCAHLLGYLLPSFPPDKFVRGWFHLGNPGGEFDQNIGTRAWPWMAHWELYAAIVFAAIMVVGLMPWRGFRRSPERRASVTRYRFWWVALWIAIPMLCAAATWIPESSPWHQRIWHGFKPGPIWEPRYLGMLVPAWILWLAASLRRLPTWPLRTVAIAFVVAASGFSALSNHLILRNPPFHKAAEIAVRYYDPKKPTTLAVGNLDLLEPGKVIPLDFDLARKIRPFGPKSWFSPYEYLHVNGHWNFDVEDRQPGDAVPQADNFLRQSSTRKQVQTIILTDREGDIANPRDGLSDESLGKILGPQWKLVDDEKYELHYEWRFYIFNTWRTRVWQRIEGPVKAQGKSSRS